MASKSVGLLQVEYLHCVLALAQHQLPDGACEELHAAGVSLMVGHEGDDDPAAAGRFAPEHRALYFVGPAVLALPLGRLPGLMARAAAQGLAWVRGDERWADAAAAARQARLWGFDDAE